MSQERLRQQFGEVMATKTFDPDDVAAGRTYVKAYVEFIHFVELLYDSTMKTPHGHCEEREAAANPTDRGSHDDESNVSSRRRGRFVHAMGCEDR